MLACDRSSSVGGIGDAGPVAGGRDAGLDGGLVSGGGVLDAGTAGSGGGGATTPASAGASAAAGQGGGRTTGQAGASGGKAGASGAGGAADAGVGGAGGSQTVGGAGGTRPDAAVDGHLCPPLPDSSCTSAITDQYGCLVCVPGGTGGSAGGVTSAGGSGGTSTGGTGGTTGAAGSSGTGKVCQRRPEDDATCRAHNRPPLAYFCEVPARPASEACEIYNGIGSGDFYCCPEPYAVCPDSPPTNDSACTGSLACTYGSHPDPTCRTSAKCTNSKWRVTDAPSRCSEQQLPATCPAAPANGTTCSSHGLNCHYADGTFCSCAVCTIEDTVMVCESGVDTWRCWTPPAGECPAFYPNLGSKCSLPASTSCQYTCASRAGCSAEGVWVDLGNLCPN